MAARKDPFAIAWLVGNELRQARVRLGETQATAAELIGCSTSRMNYMETGRSVQQADDVRALMTFYGRPVDGERLASLLTKPTRRVWWAPWKPAIPEYMQLFVGLEGFATHEFVYVPAIVPGMLQIRDYTAALVGRAHVAPVITDRIVEFRAARQERLFHDSDVLNLSVVIDEHALDRPVGGLDCLRHQLDHLLELADGDNVTVQVMPNNVAVHNGLGGNYEILDFEGMQSIVYCEYPDGAVYVADFHRVADYQYRRQDLRSMALDPAASREVVAARRAALGKAGEQADVAQLEQRRRHQRQ